MLVEVPRSLSDAICRSCTPLVGTWLRWDMKISEVIKKKGAHVVTIHPSSTVADMLGILDEYHIGALVVSEDDGASVAGIASERDIVRALHQRGVAVLEEQVGTIMTRDVWTCTSADELQSLAISMTEHRVRHVPVVEGGRLIAIVSIGDVVKHRLDELESERNDLVQYMHG